MFVCFIIFNNNNNNNFLITTKLEKKNFLIELLNNVHTNDAHSFTRQRSVHH